LLNKLQHHKNSISLSSSTNFAFKNKIIKEKTLTFLKTIRKKLGLSRRVLRNFQREFKCDDDKAEFFSS
jgi:hypothetical protein